MVVSSYRDVLEITCAMFDESLQALWLGRSDLKKENDLKQEADERGKTYSVYSDKALWLIYFISSTAVKEQFENLLDQLRSMCVHIQFVF